MKIKDKKINLNIALNKKAPRYKIKNPSFLFSSLVRLLSIFELCSTKFKFNKEIRRKIKGPCLILMNHSCFLDLKIASKILYPKKYFIVCTTDGLVGKSWLMRKIGCIPTQKFVSSLDLIADINYCLKNLKKSVLMYPEAGYSFDGRATEIPTRLGLLAKKLDVPIVTIITDGAFLHQPLYNNLKTRKVNVTAEVKLLVSKEQLREKSIDEISELIQNEFTFDAFKAQVEKKIKVSEETRAEGLERILYKCPRCSAEGKMKGENSHVECGECGAKYTLTEFGELQGENVETRFSSIPAWYDWQKDCANEEIDKNEKFYELDVDIKVLTDYKALYSVGEGKLVHDRTGITLTGCNGELNYFYPASSSYSLNVDFYWYEIGDVICVGDKEKLFYCFPKSPFPVAKSRILAEKLYKKLKNK